MKHIVSKKLTEVESPEIAEARDAWYVAKGIVAEAELELRAVINRVGLDELGFKVDEPVREMNDAKVVGCALSVEYNSLYVVLKQEI